MSTRITLHTDQVLAIASQIEADNQHLDELLKASKATLDALAADWTGAAADQTRAAYDTFAGKCFQTYFDILDQYVKFLRKNVVDDNINIESTNTRLADAFK